MLRETLEAVSKMVQANENLAVAYSGGKDSRVVLDMFAKRVERERLAVFFMYFVPGLKFIEDEMAWAEHRWNVKIRQYPHWAITTAMRNGIYCHPSEYNVPPLTVYNLYSFVLLDTNSRMVVTGAKKSDSAWRRQTIKNKKFTRVFYPLVEWNKFDVLSYLKTNGIPIPRSEKASATGVDLSSSSLLWMYHEHRDDFYRLCEYFSFAEAIVYREKFYGK